MSYTKVSPPVSPTPTLSPFSSRSSSNGSTASQKRESHLTATAKRQKYFRRLLKFRQMDFEYAFWQMIYLFISPQKVYRNFQYRKQTKDQWARDDPAFLVLLTFWLCASSIGFTLALNLGILGFIKFLLWVIFVDCIGVGLLIATLFWFISNRYMLINPPRGQDVEWGYAFDVHLNAFFPLLMILHFFQLPFLTFFINKEMFLSRFFGNTLWLLAIGYYIYITFLGYSALPYLKNTRTLLFLMTGVLLIYILSLILGWNFSWGLSQFYHDRVMDSV
ncbi:protein unc-50 homolog isoform X1 [Biomphalaria glabrata]|uniref:Protein unc-50 homolog isoform X1 n=1 Tax=Biomphalaria glabrata TaxID=6526 RepID=A0A9W3B2S3_BIOGL|nr:protein unc-50 homolog isoform X1 [Biomphalaria glabrata]XP_055893714.1 protein unc-50 homolog isoform X1 [Biomphalaria glabrata]XP_055893715.1 protein unc-50 homolog isoform X1 [Biomphalaria glabrata]